MAAKTVKKIAFVAADSPEARTSRRRLEEKYGAPATQEADVIVALGGDGFMLQTLHAYMDQDIPIYGMSCGSVGFLMNTYDESLLPERLEAAVVTALHPLAMRVTDVHGNTHSALAINEVSLLRQTHQAAKLRISVDSKVRMDELICDGALVATAAGSTAYNLSVQGPIIPIGAGLLALTPISAFRPRRWRGALLRHQARVRFEVLEAAKRPVSAVADYTEFRDVVDVNIEESKNHTLLMMYDEDHSLEERILREQFSL